MKSFSNKELETWTFSVSPMHGDKWHPSGVSNEGNEIWCDGCCIPNKRLAQMIALNMHVAFTEGWDAAMKHIRNLTEVPAPVKANGWQTEHES